MTKPLNQKKIDYTGLATTTAKSTGTSLTIANLEKAWKYLKSKKYAKAVAKREFTQAKGEQIIGAALIQEIITLEEYTKLYMSIQINGRLLISPEMHKRLLQVNL